VLSFVVISGGVRPDSVGRLLASLPQRTAVATETLIVGRHDGPLPAGVRLIPAPDLANLGAICAMRNLGIDASSGDPVILLDDDIEFTPGWYSASAPAIASRRFDVAGCRCITGTGRRWYDWCWGSRRDPSCPPRLLDYGEASPNAYISGCFMMVQRHVFATVRFDEGRGYYQRDDIDFCHRAADAGFVLGSVPEATVIHHLEAGGRSSGPASGSAAFGEGIALLRLDRYADAIGRFRAAAAEGARARYHEAVCLMELGQRAEAEAALAAVVAEFEGKPLDDERRRLHYSAIYRLAVLHEQRGRLDQAHRLYAAALAGFPEHRAAGEGHRRTAPTIHVGAFTRKA
jgi:hypothetical protein